ncbi:Nucleoporin NUP192 [Yarrowia sp. B02]|nr:Nucleoporin NUP192 [Yarrowia sp. B02]
MLTWSLELFDRLRDTMQTLSRELHDDDVDANNLRKMLNEVSYLKDDFKMSLDNPKQSASDRETIQKGKYTFGDDERHLSPEFIEGTLLIADELGLNEAAAAELVEYAISSRQGSDMSLSEAAIYAYYTRRQRILDTVRFLYFWIHEEKDKPELVSELKKIAAVIGPHKEVFDKCVDNMSKDVTALKDLDEKEKQGVFLGRNQDPKFEATLKLRRDFILQEHEDLGQTITVLILSEKLDFDSIKKLITAASALRAYNTLLLHHVPALLSVFGLIEADNIQRLSVGDTLKLRSDLFSKSTEWGIPTFQRFIQLAFLAGLAALARSDEGLSSQINFTRDILDVCRDSIDEGALEFGYTLAANTAAFNVTTIFYDLRPALQQRVPEFKFLRRLSADFEVLWTRQMQWFIGTFISHLPDLLKQMKQSEEDTFLANEAVSDPDLQLQDDVGRDLERFYMMVSSLYDGHPDGALDYWIDGESDLYGFVDWASHFADSPLMAATATNMLAALSTGPECAANAHRFLAAELPKTRNPRLTWHQVLDAFDFYVEALSPQLPNQQAATMPNALVQVAAPVLDRQATMMIEAYMHLVSQVLTYSPEAREYLFEAGLVDRVFGLLTVETGVTGIVLEALSGLAVDAPLEVKRLLWTRLDAWAFQSVYYTADGRILNNNLPPRERLQGLITDLQSAVGFSKLVERLMYPVVDIGGDPIVPALPFPFELGVNYRFPGVWVYVNYMLDDILYYSSAAQLEESHKMVLQITCFNFAKSCLRLFNPDTIRLAAAAGVSLDKIMDNDLTFKQYLIAHPCPLAMALIFNEKLYTIILGLCETSADMSSNLARYEIERTACALAIVDLVFSMEENFIDNMLPVLQEMSKKNDQIISNMSVHSFEEAILFRMTVIPHLAHHMASANAGIAATSFSILSRVSQSSLFNDNDGRIATSLEPQNRLLRAFKTYSDAQKIKSGIVEQLERPFDDYEHEHHKATGLELKLSILQFISSNLGRDSSDATVAHFLLGFAINGDGSLAADNGTYGVANRNSVFGVILSQLTQSVANIDPCNVFLDSAEFAAECAKVVMHLCRNQNSAAITLRILRDFGFFAQILAEEPVTDRQTLWNSQVLDMKKQFIMSPAPAAFSAFFHHRTALFEYFSMEVHASAVKGSLSVVKRYLDSLVTLDKKPQWHYAASQISTTALSFLDVLEFQWDTRISTQPDFGLFSTINREYVDKTFGKDKLFDIYGLLAKLYQLRAYELTKTGAVSEAEIPQLDAQMDELLEFEMGVRASGRMRERQLDFLNSWCQLVLILLNDCEMNAPDRSVFILEALQKIVPKLGYYASSDADFAEVLASLLCSLFEMYRRDIEAMNSSAGRDRSHSLFRACIGAIRTPVSTPTLRSDLYIICHKYLETAAANPALLKQNYQVVRTSGDKLLETICSDAISGTTHQRTLALMFLESLASLCTRTCSPFVLDCLVRYNLLLLLVRSIKTTDQLIHSTSEHLPLDKIMSEVTAFRAVMFFLLEIAQTRTGATQVVQCGIFQTLHECLFLNTDPDVGIQLATKEAKKDKTVDPVELYYQILTPVLRLLTAITLSMGSENHLTIERVGSILRDRRHLVVALFKKDVLNKSQYKEDDVEKKGKKKPLIGNDSLADAAKLLTVLVTLTDAFK